MEFAVMSNPAEQGDLVALDRGIRQRALSKDTAPGGFNTAFHSIRWPAIT